MVVIRPEEDTEEDVNDNKRMQSEMDLAICKRLVSEYTQKQKLPFPSYHVTISGPVHKPYFTATVTINGTCYEGEQCSTKKHAEGTAAKIALIAITGSSHIDGKAAVELNLGSFKSSLQEYAQKHKIPDPQYEVTMLRDGYFPSFIATVLINGLYFTGEACSKKKAAEGAAAKVALASLIPTLDEFLIEAPQTNEFLAEAPESNKFLIEAPQTNEFLAEAPESNEFLIEAPQTNEFLAEAPESNEFLIEAPQTNEFLSEAPESNEFLIEAPPINISNEFLTEVPQNNLSYESLVEAPWKILSNEFLTDAPPNNLSNDDTLMPSSEAMEHEDVKSEHLEWYTEPKLERAYVFNEHVEQKLKKRKSRVKKRVNLTMLGKYLIIKPKKKPLRRKLC